jgi:hypothetical protein
MVLSSETSSGSVGLPELAEQQDDSPITRVSTLM